MGLQQVSIDKPLSDKIKSVLDLMEIYAKSPGITDEQAKRKMSDELAKAITDWMMDLKLIIPNGTIVVSGSPVTQSNITPLELNFKLLK